MDGVEQKTLAVVSTQALFEITDIKDSNVTNYMMYFDIGRPKIEVNNGSLPERLSFTPKLISITPNSGSVGGSLIQLNV